MKSPIVRAISGEDLWYTPVWMMRQAGRYLPSYRAIRERYSFWEMASLPDVATQVSLLPTLELDVDGVIFFSDILTPPYGMGLGVEIREGVGPVLEKPLTSEGDFRVFEQFSPETHVPYVGQTLANIRRRVAGKQTVLGFAGAPWTLSCYLIEGKSSRHFETTHRFAAQEPEGFLRSLELVADATAKYLLYQAKQGAEVVQLFDTWLSDMPREFFVQKYVPILNRIFGPLRDAGIPSIYFCKNAHHLDFDLERLEVDGLSVDALLSLREMESRTGGKFFLQGNLDPVFLKVASLDAVQSKTRALVAESRGLRRPSILNLGHGILPQTPVENARAFLTEGRKKWS